MLKKLILIAFPKRKVSKEFLYKNQEFILRIENLRKKQINKVIMRIEDKTI